MFFVDDNKDLWVARGNSDAQKIDAAVARQFITVSSDGKGIYYLADLSHNSSITINEGTFYYIANVSQAVPKKIAENVCNFAVSDYGTVYYVCEKTDSFQHFGTAYLSRNGSKFTEVLDEAYVWGGHEAIMF